MTTEALILAMIEGSECGRTTKTKAGHCGNRNDKIQDRYNQASGSQHVNWLAYDKYTKLEQFKLEVFKHISNHKPTIQVRGHETYF